MRKIILQEFVSADSLVAGPNDSVDFIPASTQGAVGERTPIADIAMMRACIHLGRVPFSWEPKRAPSLSLSNCLN